MVIDEAVEKIKSLEIQGATNVALFAVQSLEQFAEDCEGDSPLPLFEEACAKLISSRPTEPMMHNAVRVLRETARKNREKPIRGLAEAIKLRAEGFREYVDASREQIAQIGSKRIPKKGVILNHCHSSVVMAVLKQALDNGKKFEVICTESRPRFQGRLSASELSEYGIPVTLIVDSAARTFMNGCDLVLMGADAVLSDGSVVNKIGSGMLALAAREAGTPLSVCTQTYKFDPKTLAGELEPIEERPPEEVLQNPAEGVQIKNPAFEVVAPEYIDTLLTEEGVMSPHSVYSIVRKKFSFKDAKKPKQ